MSLTLNMNCAHTGRAMNNATIRLTPSKPKPRPTEHEELFQNAHDQNGRVQGFIVHKEGRRPTFRKFNRLTKSTEPYELKTNDHAAEIAEILRKG